MHTLETLTLNPNIETVRQFERELLAMPQLTIEPVHHIVGGIYAREITIAAGTFLTGKTHKTDHINIISQGSIHVWTESGMKQIDAPCTFVSKAGAKRVGYAITDVVWTSIHATDESDGVPDDAALLRLESKLIEPEPQLNLKLDAIPTLTELSEV